MSALLHFLLDPSAPPSAPAAPGAPGSTVSAVVHAMSAAGIFGLAILSFVVDGMKVGPEEWRDRIAFAGYTAVFYDGFNGSSIDRWTIGFLQQWIDQLKKQSDAYILGITAEQAIGVAVCCFFVYVMGCVLPTSWTGKLGQWCKFKFPKCKGRINWKLFGCAAVLGLFVDLTAGTIGMVAQLAVSLDLAFMAPWPPILFGPLVS